MPIHLGIVDGQTLTRYGLRELVAQHSDIEIVAECQSAADAPAMIAAARPDVVTVDVVLPDGDGLRLAQQLRDRYADLGIVMLISRQEDDVLFRALETGVSAFVSKTAPLDEVLCAIRHAAVAPSSFTASGLATAVARRRSMQDRLTLSPRETEVLRLAARRVVNSSDRLANVHQRVHCEDIRGAAVREARRDEPSTGADVRHAPRPDPVSRGRLVARTIGVPWQATGTDRRGAVRSLALVGSSAGNLGEVNGQRLNGAAL